MISTDPSPRVLARVLKRHLARARGRPRAILGQHGAGREVPTAGRLLAAATHLLPAADRAQYAEEFRSELWEIAHVGGRRRAQLAYAARQLMAGGRLRAELRVPRRRGATPG
jgi:hypothetical protein